MEAHSLFLQQESPLPGHSFCDWLSPLRVQRLGQVQFLPRPKELGILISKSRDRKSYHRGLSHRRCLPSCSHTAVLTVMLERSFPKRMDRLIGNSPTAGSHIIANCPGFALVLNSSRKTKVRMFEDS